MVTFFPLGLHGAVQSQYFDRDRRISNELREFCPHWDPPFHTKTNFLLPHTYVLLSVVPRDMSGLLRFSQQQRDGLILRRLCPCWHRRQSVVVYCERSDPSSPSNHPPAGDRSPLHFQLVFVWTVSDRFRPGFSHLRLHRAIGESCELIRSVVDSSRPWPATLKTARNCMHRICQERCRGLKDIIEIVQELLWIRTILNPSPEANRKIRQKCFVPLQIHSG